MIEGMLAEDRETWRKQRHTATRIHERLRDGYGAGVSLSTVTRTVARLRREAAAERERFGSARKVAHFGSWPSMAR